MAVDIRRESATFSKQETVELTAENRLALVLPPYVAHGFQTLADDTEAKYQVSGPTSRGMSKDSVGMTRSSTSPGRCRSPSSPERTPAGR